MALATGTGAESSNQVFDRFAGASQQALDAQVAATSDGLGATHGRAHGHAGAGPGGRCARRLRRLVRLRHAPGGVPVSPTRRRAAPAVVAVVVVAALGACSPARERAALAPAPAPTPTAPAPTSAAVDVHGSAGGERRLVTARTRRSALEAAQAQTIRKDRLVAGVSADTLLMGSRNPATAEIEGFDIDLLREVAQALFGDPDRPSSSR